MGIFEEVRDDLFHHGHAAPKPTFTPAKSSQPEVPVTALSTIRQDLSNVGGALQHAWPMIEALAANKLVEAIAEEGIGLVLAPAEVTAVVGFIKALEAAKGTSAPAPALAPDGGTGTQAARTGTPAVM